MAPLLTGRLFLPELYHFFNTVDSTNRVAARLAQEGALEGTVVVSDHQSHGRGRLGRHWSSPAGKHLYFSVVLRPAIPPNKAPQLTLLASLALAQAVFDAGVEVVEIKWPNDLLLHGRKVAGILTEMRTDPGGVLYVIVGIGVNIHGQSNAFSLELQGKTATLAEFLHSGIQRPVFLASVLAQLTHRYEQFQTDGFCPIRRDWLAFSKICGRRVRINSAGTTSSVDRCNPADSYSYGIAKRLDPEGFLEVLQSDGTLCRVLAGDVMILDEGEVGHVTGN